MTDQMSHLHVMTCKPIAASRVHGCSSLALAGGWHYQPSGNAALWKTKLHTNKSRSREIRVTIYPYIMMKYNSIMASLVAALPAGRHRASGPQAGHVALKTPGGHKCQRGALTSSTTAVLKQPTDNNTTNNKNTPKHLVIRSIP